MSIINHKYSRRLITMLIALFLSICVLYIFNSNVVYARATGWTETDTYNRNDTTPSSSSSSGSSTSSKSSSSEKSSTSKDSGKSITEYMQEIEKRDREVRVKVDTDYKTYPINWTTVYNQLDKVKDKVKKGETTGSITIREYEEHSYPTYYIENNTMVWYTQVIIKPKIVAKFGTMSRKSTS